VALRAKLKIISDTKLQKDSTIDDIIADRVPEKMSPKAKNYSVTTPTKVTQQNSPQI